MAFTIEASVDPQVYVSEKEERDAYVPENYHISDGTTPNLETYMYYAKIQRDKEALSAKNDTEGGLWGGLFSRKSTRSQESDRRSVASANSDGKNVTPPSDEGGAALVTAGEYRAASGALRTATWGSVFYLITTDILGPYSTPWAFQQVGYGPGVACFFVFGIMAAYGGFILWRLFLKLDSERYPVKSFGELGQRIYGRWFGNLCNILQSLQLVFNVGIIILQNGQGLSQMAKFKLCFSVCNVVWTLAGMFLGQIRTLQKFGSIANLAIWMNILVLIMTMACVANSPPNYVAAPSTASGPVMTQAINLQAFQNQLNGIMQIVFSYGGAMIFVEFMAEMRRPMDFWKAMAYSQIFIFVVYMFFGLFVYSYQGQYVVNPANQGISTYSLQTATNAISLTAGLIAAALYGNIGVKIIYNNLFVEVFGFPQLTMTRGKYYFAICVVVYWAIAFIIGSAIPQFSALSSLIAAVCIFQFTYTFPPFMILGYFLQVDASKNDGEFDINNPYAHRVDSWKDISRWERAFFSNSWHFLFTVWNFLLTLACLACATLSAYSAITTIVTAFQTSSSAAFGCHSPLDVSG